MPPRIALIHATALAVAPINQAFARLWPEAQLMNLLDDSLSVDHAKNNGALSNAMIQRFVDLATYAKVTGADAILFTCSAFGAAIEVAGKAVGLPTLKPNEAMFEQALRLTARKAGKVALVATFDPSLKPMCAEYSALGESLHLVSSIEPCFVPEAMAALAQGDEMRHHQLVAHGVSKLPPFDIVLLAQFSMAAAMPIVQASTNAIVLASPDCAVAALRKRLH
jgi:hypothetical protein